jgi:type II secretory pathway component PulF
MKYFEVTYLIGGEKNKTVIQSLHKIDALKQFQEKTLGMMVSMQEINEPFSLRFENYLTSIKKSSFKKKVKLEPYIASLRQLGVMLDAGIPVNQCFMEVVNTTDNAQLKEIFGQIALKVESGSSISESFEDYSYELGNLSYSIISLGEQTGELSESVIKLSNILDEIHQNRKKLKAALRYPAIVITAMIGAFIAVITMVVPQFKEMFEENGAELPLPTQILLNIEVFIKESGLFLLIGIMALIFTHVALYSQKGKYKYLTDKYMLKIYLVGKITHLSMTGRFMFVFNKLTNSGIPIIKALGISKNIVENDYLKERFKLVEESIEEGKTLTQGFESSEQFENMIIQMIKAGETSGALNKMLEKVDTYYSAKYNDLVDNISTYIEPIMIAVLAAFVTLMALGIFLPMWSMAEVVGN